MGDKRAELDKYRISHTHFIFTLESADEAKRAIGAYFSAKPLGVGVRRVGRRDFEK